MPLSRRAAITGLAASAWAVTSVKAAAEPMRIGVIGAGWLGGTVGMAWVQAGHEVLFSTRHPDRLAAMARELGPRASVGTPRQAAEFGPVVLVAVPYDALAGVGRELGEALRGKVVLDACNPPPGNAEAETKGVGAMSAGHLPGTRLVRAFSAVDATAVEASFGGQSRKLGVPLAGDDPEAVRTAAQLVRDAGCEPVVVGDLAAARSFQRGGPGFRANTAAPDLRRRLGLPEAG
ncbi:MULTISPECIES: NADPH-dependent F420 reductase [unclassified Methylobacterium]|uniref:NADPH-dependent F420 reductase n=1 Tax=unclassified Methylobacterium TaxID=2615210 RepID=UPI00226ACD08|nr:MULTISPECIES: NADPH-dependent F420 reductase [unclassified Methylobacterium]